MAKIMISIGDDNFRVLTLEAKERGITIQELLRAVIVPDWVRASIGPSVQRENSSFPSIRLERRENEVAPVFNRTRS